MCYYSVVQNIYYYYSKREGRMGHGAEIPIQVVMGPSRAYLNPVGLCLISERLDGLFSLTCFLCLQHAFPSHPHPLLLQLYFSDVSWLWHFQHLGVFSQSSFHFPSFTQCLLMISLRELFCNMPGLSGSP